MKKIKSTKGITLIALVITILILIILAGVSVSVLFNQDGIITKAKQAQKSTEISKITEQLELEKENYLLENEEKTLTLEGYIDYIINKGIVDNIQNGADENSKIITVNNYMFLIEKEEQSELKIKYIGENNSESLILIKSITLNKTETELVIGKNETETLIATITPENATNKELEWTSSDEGIVQVTKEGVITAKSKGTAIIKAKSKDIIGREAECKVTVQEPTLADQTAKNCIGDTINYSANGIKDWRIFYKEGNDVFIIMDYLLQSKIPSSTGVDLKNYTSYKYSAIWNSAPTLQTGWATNKNLFKATKYTLKSSNSNSKVVSVLLNTSNWKSFVDTNYADLAIGSPTIEMWCASWNEKGYTKLTPSASTNGYKINNEGYLTEVDTLYFPHPEYWNKCYGYIIASPNNYDTGYIMTAYEGRKIYKSDYGSKVLSLRPVVHLNSAEDWVKDENGVWQPKS